MFKDTKKVVYQIDVVELNADVFESIENNFHVCRRQENEKFVGKSVFYRNMQKNT